jgi:hypothetical protein
MKLSELNDENDQRVFDLLEDPDHMSYALLAARASVLIAMSLREASLRVAQAFRYQLAEQAKKD